ncbi:helicase [Seminavis robusta]|uniref:Helicase n=1 Tax=Seminavis robusta TaxID=568900 RepID=A0A9N8EMQ3_9STRA|nr:helicase [Seminavis robusta]|eukprot:Sro1486_g276650.1 helicase (651) ;mRNA; f:16828-19090
MEGVDSTMDAQPMVEQETASPVAAGAGTKPAASKSPNFFAIMAQSYLDNELYKDNSDEDKWNLAVKEFYDAQGTAVDSRKPTEQIKGHFLTGLFSRIKDLPEDPDSDVTDEQKLCRQIKGVLNVDDALLAPPEPVAPAPVPKKRLYFSRDNVLFITMAKCYLSHEVYKSDKWDQAVNAFYEQHAKEWGEQLLARKKNINDVKRPFLSGLEYRIKSLPRDTEPDDPEEVKLCRMIRDMRESARADRISHGQEPAEGGRKRRRGGTGNDQPSRGRPRQVDLNMSPAMLQRYQAVKAERVKEEKAAEAVADAQIALVEAQKRLEEAKQRKLAMAEHVKEVSAEFSRDVINESGPWKDMYLKLVQYKHEHGNCNIIRGQTQEMKDLRKWVLRQRDRYNKKEGQPSKLPWYLAQSLEDLGFVWKYSDGTWEKHYSDLIAYKAENGDCLVPRGYKRNPTLAHWVKRMRHEGNKFKRDPSSVSMTAEQLQKLESIGFVWENLSRSWFERYEELREFKRQHGHTRVPKEYPENPQLVAWCANQRAHYRAFMLGKRSCMNESRIKQLEDAGFQFEQTGPERSKPRRSPPGRVADEKSDSSEDEDDQGEEEHVEVPQMVARAPFAVAAYQNNAFAYREPHDPPYPIAYPHHQQPRYHPHF